MVLLEQSHDVICEVTHVFADHKANMATLDLLVVDDCVSDCVPYPLGIFNVS